MTPPRAECGSSRCACDHAGCDLGWLEGHEIRPNGAVAEVHKKCPACFPMPPASTPDTRNGHPHWTDARELGAAYVDHAAAAAGDKTLEEEL